MLKIISRQTKKSFLIRLVLLTAFTITSFLCIKKLALSNHNGNFFTPSTITYEILNNQNIKQQLAMINFITKQTSSDRLMHFNQQQFYTQLKTAFPHVSSLEWKMLASKTLHMTIAVTEPEVIINNSYALGDKNKLLPLDLFDGADLQTLPHLYVHNSLISKSTLNQEVFNFIETIPHQLLDIFDIRYYSASKILLKNKKKDYNYQIITNKQTLPNERTKKYIANIFKDLEEKNIITPWRLHNQRGPFIFDMRIKNQIIVKLPEPLKRGRGA